MKCVVIGSGAFGFAIALNLLKNGNDVTAWCSSNDKLNEILKTQNIDSRTAIKYEDFQNIWKLYSN